jgi:AcrR family transcriptional regulator
MISLPLSLFQSTGCDARRHERYHRAMTGKAKRGVSKSQWLEAALELLAEKGATGVTIERLARRVGVARSGFYWHFRDRDELLKGVLDHWTHELTGVIAENPLIQKLPPRERLQAIAEAILDYDLTRYELVVRQWALHDQVATRAVRRVNRLRLTIIRQAFDELGFDEDEADMRARTFACYYTWEAPMFPELSRKRRRQQITLRLDLLTHR